MERRRVGGWDAADPTGLMATVKRNPFNKQTTNSLLKETSDTCTEDANEFISGAAHQNSSDAWTCHKKNPTLRSRARKKCVKYQPKAPID